MALAVHVSGNRFPRDTKSPSQLSQRNIAVRAQFSEPVRKVLVDWFVHDFLRFSLVGC